MHRTLGPLLLLAATLLPGFAGAAPVQQPQFVQDEVLVRYRNADTAVPIGLAVERLRGSGQWRRVKLAPGQSVAAALKDLAGQPDVAAVQPNYLYRAVALPDDPGFTEQWALDNRGQMVSGATAPPLSGISGGDIGMAEAWERTTDCRGTVIAVLDTGVQYTHPDLQANLWDGSPEGLPHHGWDAVAGDDDPLPVGTEIHGTHIAGIIAAEGNNGIGTTGVCWHARLMLVRVLDQDGAGSTASLVEGVHFAVDHGAHILNMSLGRHGAVDPMLEAAITYARDNGVLVVASAGNGGSDGLGDDNDAFAPGDAGATSTYPCAFEEPNLVCVTALDQSYSLASYANFGARSVDVGAPGSNIFAPAGSTGYQTLSGTSMAAPHATGIAAMLWTLNPAYEYQDLVKALRESGPALPSLAGTTLSGRAVDAADALRHINPPQGLHATLR